MVVAMLQLSRIAGFRTRFGQRAGERRGERYIAVVVGAAIGLTACGGLNTGRPGETGGSVATGGSAATGGSGGNAGAGTGGSPTTDGGPDAGGASGIGTPGSDGAALAAYCNDATGLEFQNIVNFETPNARCDPAVAPTSTMQTSCLYFNYDSDTEPLSCHPAGSLPVVHTPPLCTIPADLRPPESCLLATGDLAGPDRCSLSNIVGGTVTTEAIPGTRCGTSQSAMHLVATDLGMCRNQITGALGWGAGLSITFFANANGYSTNGFDATAWDGLSFWVRQGTGPSLSVFYAVVHDPFTDRTLGLPAALQPPGPTPFCQNFINTFCDSSNVVYASPPGGGPCKPTVPDYCKCDGYWNGVGMTGEWHFIMLPFADMNQKGYGVPSPLGHLDTAHITSLNLSFSSQAALGGSWDLWIDDVAFYRKAR